MRRSSSEIHVRGGCGCLILIILIVGVVFGLVGGCTENREICTAKVVQTPLTEEQKQDLKQAGTADYSGMTMEKECHTYVPYGIANPEDRNPDIRYEVSGGNIFWSVILSETIFVPIYLIGWYLYQPVGVRDPNGIPGTVQ